MNPRQQLKALFRGKAMDRPLFVPLIGTYLSKVNQKPMQDIFYDAGLLHQGLRDAQQLLQADAVITPLDEALEAEAFGCRVQWNTEQNRMVVEQGIDPESYPELESWVTMGRIPVFIEAVKRFAQVEGKQIPLFATITGPVTLAHLLHADVGLSKISEISQYLIHLIKAYAEAGADGIIINEGVQSGQMAKYDPSLSVDYKPLVNVIRYYNKFALIRWVGPPPGTEQMVKANVHGLIAPTNEVPLNEKFVWGIPLKNELLTKDGRVQDLTQGLNLSQYKRKFLTTAEPLNQEEGDLYILQENINKIIHLTAAGQ